jgi:hypothetical protein
MMHLLFIHSDSNSLANNEDVQNEIVNSHVYEAILDFVSSTNMKPEYQKNVQIAISNLSSYGMFQSILMYLDRDLSTFFSLLNCIIYL